MRSFREYRLTLMIYKISSDSFRTSAHFRGSPCRKWSRTCQLAQIFSLSQRENSTEGFVARSAPAALFWAFASSLVITACLLTFALSKWNTPYDQMESGPQAPQEAKPNRGKKN